MADDITDVYIATETGDAGWQSLTALVEAKLPIESVDGTVKLDSPSANTFTVSTNSVDNRLAVNGRGMVGIGNAGTNPICLYVNSVPTNATGLSGITCIPEIITAEAEEVSALKTQANLGASVAANFFYHFLTGSSTGTGTAAIMNGVRIVDTSLTGTTKNVAFSTNLPADSEKNFSIETGTAPSTFNGDIRTSKVAGKAFSTDASIELGATVTVDASQFTPLTVTNDQSGVLIRTRNKDNRQYWHGQDDNGWAVCTRQTINGSVQAVRSFGVTGDYALPDWRVYSGGFQADYWLKSPKVSGLNDTHASVELGADFDVSTNGQATLKQNDGSAYVATSPDSLVTEKLLSDQVDNLIWVGTTAEYQAIGIYNNKTLYCITD